MMVPSVWPVRIPRKGRHRRHRQVTVRFVLRYAAVGMLGGLAVSVATLGLYLSITGVG